MTGNDTVPNRRPGGAPAISYLWRVVGRNRALVIGLPVLVIAATALFVMAVTPSYEAGTTIRIDEKRTPIPLMDALATLAPGGSRINTEMEVLRSRSLAESVIDSLDLQLVVDEPARERRSEVLSEVHAAGDALASEFRLERRDDGRFDVELSYKEPGASFLTRPTTESLGPIAPGEMVAARGARFTLASGAAEHDEIAIEVLPLHEAVKEFQKQLLVSRPTREADILLIRYESTDPELTRDVPNLLAARFVETRQVIQASEAAGTVRFLEAQVAGVTSRLAETEQELKDFRESAEIVDLEAQGSAEIERLAEIQGARDLIEADRAALATLMRQIEATEAGPDEPSPYRRLLAFPTLLGSGATSELLQILSTLDTRRAELLETRTPAEPEVQVLSGRIAEIERQLHSIASTYLASLSEQSASLGGTLASSRDLLSEIPAKQVTLARLIREAGVSSEIYKLLQVRLKEAEIAESVEDMSIRVVDPAAYPVEPFKPQPVVSLGLALILGLFAGIGGALLREHLDTRLRTREELQELTDLTVLGMIPTIHRERPGTGTTWRRIQRRARSNGGLAPRLLTDLEPHDPVTEAFRGLRTSIAFATPGDPPKAIVVTSAMPADGKSTTAINLAITLAQQGQRVVLVDADLRRGSMNFTFDVEREPGLANVLLGRTTAGAAVRRVELGAGLALDLMPTGALPPNPAELLGGRSMGTLLDQLRAEYDSVILDAPPLSLVTDAAVLGSKSDGVLLVARAGVTDRGALGFALEQLRTVRAPVLGTVLNDAERPRSYYGRAADRTYGRQPA